MSRRRLWVPVITTAVMLALLLGLGTWQVQRRAWKLGVLAQFDAAERNPPVPLVAGLPPFAKVIATGHLRRDLAASYGAEVRDAHGSTVLGTQLIVPLERADAPPVLVDLGWIPTDARERVAAPAGETGIVGFIRPAEHPGWFSAPDDPQHRQFYTLDPAAIGAALGLPQVAPFVLVAVGGPATAGMPDPARHLPDLPNNHLQYALTWYGLALVLLAVFVVYLRRGNRA